jgi:hypothetical protein
MSNKKQTKAEKPNTTNPARPSKLPNPKKGSGNPKERDQLQPNQEKKPQDKSDNADKIVTGQSGNDVNGNELEENLRNGPAH